MEKKNLKDWQERCPQREARKSPSAELIAWTPSPFVVIHSLFHHNKFGDSIEVQGSMPTCATDEQVDFVIDLLKEDWCALTEAATFVWQFVLPRSLHAQLRAHRTWAFFSESHRQSIPIDFAALGDYFKIPTESKEVRALEEDTMREIQGGYRLLLDEGCLPALARGVLPMHVNLGLAGACSLRTLFRTVLRRNCDILQGSYWTPLLMQMESELVQKVDIRFRKLFQYRPCDVFNQCQSPIEQNLRISKRDPHEPCPIYLEKFDL